WRSKDDHAARLSRRAAPFRSKPGGARAAGSFMQPSIPWPAPAVPLCALRYPAGCAPDSGPSEDHAMAIPDNLLAALPPALSQGLVGKGGVVTLGAGQGLVLGGDAGDSCYRVEEGLLKASVVAPAGGERILAIFGPGSLVGELSMIDGVPRSASVA